MEFLKKNWLWIAIVLVIVVAFFWWKKSSGASAEDSAPVDRKAQLLADETLITRYINIIKASAQWYASVKEKAVKNGRTEADQLRRDALYMIEQDYNAGKL